jgi:hypothetical protein
MTKHFLSWGFYVWACEYFFLLHRGLHLIKLLHKNWYSPHFIMWNVIIERISGPKNNKCILFLNVVPMYFSFWLFLLRCVLIILLNLCIISLLYHKPYDIIPFIFLQACFKWHGCLPFKREKNKIYKFKTTYLSNY